VPPQTQRRKVFGFGQRAGRVLIAPLAQVLFVMGFACCRAYWDPQVGFVARWGEGGAGTRSPAPDGGEAVDMRGVPSEVCCFDNRGVGASGLTLGAYSTRQLAEDAIAILEHTGWVSPPAAPARRAPHRAPRGLGGACGPGGAQRASGHVAGGGWAGSHAAGVGKGRVRLHIVGWSLGGMIAQELSLMLMDRGAAPASLCLACTHSGGWRLLPPWSSWPSILSVASALSLEARIRGVLPLHHTAEFLDEDWCFGETPPPSPARPGALRAVRRSKSGREVLSAAYEARAPFAGPLLWQLPGVVGHLLATASHFVSPARLRRLGGPDGPWVLVISAGRDRLIPSAHSRDLVAALGGAAQLLDFADNGPPPAPSPSPATGF